MAKMYRIRPISKNVKNEEVYGVTIPKEFTEDFKNCRCTITKSGNCLILQSGGQFIPNGNKYL